MRTISRNNTIYRHFGWGAKALAIVLTALAFSTPVLAGPPRSARTAASLIRIEQQWLAAINRHDVTTIGRILGREFIDSDFQGDAITRAQYLTYFAHPALQHPLRAQQSFDDTKVRFIAHGEVAIVTGIVVTRPAAASTIATPGVVRYSRFTDVFVWRAARWQAVSGQETHFTPARSELEPRSRSAQKPV